MCSCIFGWIAIDLLDGDGAPNISVRKFIDQLYFRLMLAAASPLNLPLLPRLPPHLLQLRVAWSPLPCPLPWLNRDI